MRGDWLIDLALVWIALPVLWLAYDVGRYGITSKPTWSSTGAYYTMLLGFLTAAAGSFLNGDYRTAIGLAVGVPLGLGWSAYDRR